MRTFKKTQPGHEADNKQQGDTAWGLVDKNKGTRDGNKNIESRRSQQWFAECNSEKKREKETIEEYSIAHFGQESVYTETEYHRSRMRRKSTYSTLCIDFGANGHEATAQVLFTWRQQYKEYFWSLRIREGCMGIDISGNGMMHGWKGSKR
jgi:hypothetical protein